jgi:hypothetical protein
VTAPAARYRIAVHADDPGRDTESVLQFVSWNAVLLSDNVQGIARTEPVEHVLDTSPTTGEGRLAERPVRVCNDFGVVVLRQTNQSNLTVRSELHSVQVGVDNLGKDPLAMANHNQFPSTARLGGVPLSFGEVVQHLGTVGGLSM